MFNLIKDVLEDVYLISSIPRDGQPGLDDRAIVEIQRFLTQDDSDIDPPPADSPDLPEWLRNERDGIVWLYEYLTKSTNMIYGSTR